MRILLVDDEPVVRKNLILLIGRVFPFGEVIGEASGVEEGILQIKKLNPELVILDIEMEDGTGFDLLSIYGTPDFKVIFATGHDGYAINAFKYNAVHYLLKPVDPEELKEALVRAKGASLEEQTERIDLAKKQLNSSSDKSALVLRDAENVYYIEVGTIKRLESFKNYTKFYIEGTKPELLITKTMKEFEERLQGFDFVRVHHSHIVSLQHIDFYEKKNGGMLVMKDGSRVPVSTRKKDDLLMEMEKKSF
jgi:two-component system LytT family response regulator